MNYSSSSKYQVRQKKCSKCGLKKPYSEFHVDNKAPDRHSYWCKSCHHEAYKRRMARLENKLKKDQKQIPNPNNKNTAEILSKSTYELTKRDLERIHKVFSEVFPNANSLSQERDASVGNYVLKGTYYFAEFLLMPDVEKLIMNQVPFKLEYKGEKYLLVVSCDVVSDLIKENKL